MIGNILGVAGLILTIIFGIYSIWAAKKSDKKVSLGLERKECYSLFKSDISRLKIDIKYNNNVVDNYLILFKGILVNNGKTDIDKSRIYKPLQIKTKKEYKWLETNVYGKPVGSNINAQKLNDTAFELSWDLLKAKEKIEFESLIEVPNNVEINQISEDFFNSLTFDFRITDINQIDKLSEVSIYEKRRQKSKQMLLFMSILTFVIGIYLFFLTDIPKRISILKPMNIEYSVLSKSDTINTTFNIKDEQVINFKIKDLEIEKDIALFNKEYKLIKINRIVSDTFLFSKIMGGVYIALSIAVFLLYYKRRSRKHPAT